MSLAHAAAREPIRVTVVSPRWARPLLRAICVGVATGATAGALWANVTTGDVGRGTVIGIVAGAIAGALQTVFRRG